EGGLGAALDTQDGGDGRSREVDAVRQANRGGAAAGVEAHTHDPGPAVASGHATRDADGGAGADGWGGQPWQLQAVGGRGAGAWADAGDVGAAVAAAADDAEAIVEGDDGATAAGTQGRGGHGADAAGVDGDQAAEVIRGDGPLAHQQPPS